MAHCAEQSKMRPARPARLKVTVVSDATATFETNDEYGTFFFPICSSGDTT